MSKLLPNLPIEDLTEENDYLGIIEKADLIKTFLESNTDEFEQIKMFVLYGEWGSGKSTLMKYLEKELKGVFNTFFFEAWEFENDTNLCFSLLEFLTLKSEGASEQVIGDILKLGGKLFRGLGRSLKLKVPLAPGGPELEIDPSSFVEEFDADEKTFYQIKEDFKFQFRGWEDMVTKDKKTKHNIVFIDDLDRCEPENVLNLLSALKLFFTYGKKTIFFCGIDKKAVEIAIKTKYFDYIKSTEYLEKIFDISFSMPKAENSIKLFGLYFSNDKKYELAGQSMSIAEIVNFLFNELRFNNIRKIKKVLNRFVIVQNITKNLSGNHKLKKIAPNILNDENCSLLDLLITIYFVVLKEFYPMILEDFSNNSLRLTNYESSFSKTPGIDASGLSNNRNAIKIMVQANGRNEKFLSIQRQWKVANNDLIRFRIIRKMIIDFAPVTPEYLDSSCFDSPASFYEGFRIKKKEVDYFMCYFLIRFFNDLISHNAESNSSSIGIWRFVKAIP
ncbi:MAG: hypothetical protein Aureis2KO_27320 [Aureisphaera sp.]